MAYLTKTIIAQTRRRKIKPWVSKVLRRDLFATFEGGGNPILGHLIDDLHERINASRDLDSPSWAVGYHGRWVRFDEKAALWEFNKDLDDSKGIFVISRVDAELLGRS